MYDFADNLRYEADSWQYCSSSDRRFFREHIEGLRPAGDEQLTNDHPPRAIPPGTFDIGRGYYRPSDKQVYDFSGRLIGALTTEDPQWVQANCRQGPTDDI